MEHCHLLNKTGNAVQVPKIHSLFTANMLNRSPTDYCFLIFACCFIPDVNDEGISVVLQGFSLLN
jgi:hypothetical protein